MATVYHYDLYPRTDPKDGTRLVRFTSLQKATYRDVIGVGSGVGVLRSTHADADFLDPLGEQYVRVVEETDAVETVVGGFWLSDNQHETAVRRDTKRLTIAGPGTLAYLARSVMAPHTYIHDVFTGQDPYDDLWRLGMQSTFYANGAHLGAMLWRVIYEAQHYRTGATYTHKHADGLIYTDSHADDRTGGSAIAELTMGFDQNEDSDGNDWTLESGEFTARVGENVLSVVQRLIQAGLYLEMDPDTFELRAWEGRPTSRGGRSTDRTGSSWASDVVRFQSPTDGTTDTGNIKSDTKRKLKSFLRRTLVWAGAQDVYAKSTAAGDVRWEGFESANLGTTAALQQLASAQITAREEAADAVDPKMKLGDDPANGFYRPWQEVRLDELVTVHTGSGTWDFDSQTFPVAGLRIELQSGGDWAAYAELGASFEAGRERQFTVPPSPATNELRLCDAFVPGSGGLDVLYDLNWEGVVEETVAIYPSGTGDWPVNPAQVGASPTDPLGDGSGVVEWGGAFGGDASSPQLPATAGTTYRWEGYIRSTCAGDGGSGIVVKFYNVGSGELSTTFIATIDPPANTWEAFSTDVVAPTGAVSMKMVPTGIGACRAYYDKIVVSGVSDIVEEENPYAGNSPYAARCDHTHPAADHEHDDEYAPLGHSHSLVELDDVDVSTPPTDGQVLAFDDATETWVPSTASGGGLTVEDEGSPLSTDATTLDFVGAGVTATGSGATKTITIPGGGGGVVAVHKSADETVNNTSTLQNDDHILFAVGANEKWAFELQLFVIGNSTADFKMGWSVPSGATMRWFAGFGATAAGGDLHGLASGELLTESSTRDLYVNGTTHHTLVGYVFNGATPGNVVLRWAQNTANASNTTLERGTFLIAHLLS